MLTKGGPSSVVKIPAPASQISPSSGLLGITGRGTFSRLA